MNQKNIEEEHRCLEIHIDKSPFDQSTCYLPLEVQKSLGKGTTDGSNEGTLKYQAPLESTNTDYAFSLFLSNENIAGEIIGRSTRSRAHGKICKRKMQLIDNQVSQQCE